MHQQDDARATPTVYRIQQLGPPRDRDGAHVNVHGRGVQRNESVKGFDDLVLHHPGDNRAARMEGGLIVSGEPGRMHAHIGGRLEEIEISRNGRDHGLGVDQVLIKKDFILSHPALDPSSSKGRSVDVPAPVAGVIGVRHDEQGLVDILDRADGEVIARFRHLQSIKVSVGDPVVYGQTLGTQSDVATPRIHVHMEMDTRYYAQFRDYVDDLASGRLPIEAEHRAGLQPRPVVEAETFRLGESSARIRDLQSVMDREGYRAAGGGPLDRDGVYRLGMQGALLDFQRDHGIPQTGDVDPATLQFAPASRSREMDRLDHVERGRMPRGEPQPPGAPGHPDHPDHRPGLPEHLEPAVNQRRAQSGFRDPRLDPLMAAFETGDAGAVSQAFADITQSPQGRAWLQSGRDQLAAQATQAPDPQVAVEPIQAAALARS